jgi:hypothetical protein
MHIFDNTLITLVVFFLLIYFQISQDPDLGMKAEDMAVEQEPMIHVLSHVSLKTAVGTSL